MHLLDTNIFLEILLDQDKAKAARTFIEENENLFMTDFTLHSIGIILLRLGKPDTFKDFVEDMVLSGYITVRRLFSEDMPDVCDAAVKYGLDFDDAYQYVAARKYSLKLVSFDSDFDRTDIKSG